MLRFRSCFTYNFLYKYYTILFFFFKRYILINGNIEASQKKVKQVENIRYKSLILTYILDISFDILLFHMKIIYLIDIRYVWPWKETKHTLNNKMQWVRCLAKCHLSDDGPSSGGACWLGWAQNWSRWRNQSSLLSS